MKYAIIENNKIVNIAVADTYLAINWVQLQDGFGIGDNYVNGIFSKEILPIEVPQTITKLQAMKQLQKIEKWTQLKAILADPANEDINDEWILSNDLNRSYPLVAQMAAALELTEDEVDNLFIEASQIV